MYVSRLLMELIKSGNESGLLGYKANYLKNNTLVDWYKLYDTAIAAINAKAKVFPEYSDKSYVGSIEPQHNED